MVFEIVALCAFLYLIGYSIYRITLYRIKSSLYLNAPKVGVTYCDKGHVFPDDLGLKLTEIPCVEGDVILCPICYDTNLRNAEELIHKSEEARNAAASKTDSTAN